MINADGTDKERMTDDDRVWLISAPAWSPDGFQMIFSLYTSNGDGEELYIMNTDGTGLQRLTDFINDMNYPSWLPDGTQILIRVEKPFNRGDIYIMNADGSNLHPITNTPENETNFQWRPNTP